MNPTATSDFLRGLAAGIGVTLTLLLAVLHLPAVTDGTVLERIPELDPLFSWIGRNLGLSVLPFALTLLLFVHSLRQLRTRLRDGSPAYRVAQADQLGETWIGLFFGIGVLWTAIGMRSALLFALGDGADSVSGGGAADLLERLVEGGILTALTTTIVGGAGGYLLRLAKALSVGDGLKRFYGRTEQERVLRVEGLLEQIRDRLPQEGAGEAPCP